MRVALIGSNSRISKYIAEFISFDGFSRDNISYDKETIQNKVKGYDSVIIAIGITSGPKDKMYKINVKVLEEILQGLDASNIIFLSSIAVYGRKNYKDYNESSPVIEDANNYDYYGLTKLIGEQLVKDYSKSNLILRIGTIFGEYYKDYIEMIKLWKNKNPFYFGDGKNKVPFIYARDVAKFISKNLNNKGLINVTSEGIEFLEVVESVREVFKIEKEPLPFYKYLAKEIPIPFLSDSIAKILEKYYINKEKIYPLTLSRSFKIQKAVEFGLELTPFKEAIKCFLRYI